MPKHLLTFLFAAASGVFVANAQLAITEVMTAASSTTNGLPGAPNHPDWWELTNFGTNDVDLTGYSWNDNSHNGLFSANTAPFTGVIIRPGEAIVFAQQNAVITDADTFRNWWGISASVQVFLYPPADPGLGAGGDSVRLWSTNNLNGDFDISFDEALPYQVDRADTGVAIDGRSLVYNPATGRFDASSTNGVAGAFKAVTADDEGSPGVAPSPVPITISQQPASFTTTVGQSAAFTIAGRGLPRPLYQWLFNGAPVDTNTPGLTITYANNGAGILTLLNVQTNQAGTYLVVIGNGLESFASSNAVLTVNPAPTKPSITQRPVDVNAYPGQTATFTVQAQGNPPPTYAWQFSGGAISGAQGSTTTNQLVLSITDTNQSGTYTCVVTNTGGATNVSAMLTVAPKPYLLITEVMSSENNNTNNHADWWELTNFGNTPADLRGYRMNDSHTLGSAYTITNAAIIQPGESVVFVEGISAQVFRAWWGSSLPPGLQIITYDPTGRGLSSGGDEIRLWNQAATTEADRVAAVPFSTATGGTSFSFDPQATNQLGFLGNNTFGLSTNGLGGAFAAAQNGDVGSPGRIVNWPGAMTIAPGTGGWQLVWNSQPVWDYIVEAKESLFDAAWLTVTNITSDNTNSFGFVDTAAADSRYYRVRLKPNKAP